MEEPTNYLGAAIFWLYIVFALVFTGKTLQTLFSLYTTTYKTKSSRHTKQIWLFSLLALLSFATLSTTMLNVLIQSFHQKTLLKPSPPSGNLSFAIWNWSTTSSLFTDFAEGLVQDSARFFWAQTALLATLSTVIYMGTEGRQRQIPNLWTFFALSQILPISFAQNLFYVALLLTSPETETEADETTTDNNSSSSSSQRILHFSKTHSILSAAAYCLTLALAQLYASTPALLPLVLLARLALLFPLLIPAQYYPSAASVPDPKKGPQDRATADEVQRVVLKTALIMTCMKAYQAVQEGFSVGDIAVALWGHPAVLALGGDLFLCAVGFTAWNYAGPRMRVVAGKPAAAAATAGKTAAAVEGRKEKRKAARKSGGGVVGRR